MQANKSLQLTPGGAVWIDADMSLLHEVLVSCGGATELYVRTLQVQNNFGYLSVDGCFQTMPIFLGR